MFQAYPALDWRERLWRLPWFLIAVMCLIASVGVATLYSVAGGSFEPWAARHGLRFVFGLSLAIICALVPIAIWRSLAGPAYILALGLLAAVPIVGTEALGARRWLSIGNLSIQPVEIMKVTLVVALAQLYATLASRRQAQPIGTSAMSPSAGAAATSFEVSQPKWVLAALALIAIPAALTLRQPDLGSAILLVGIGLGVMFLAGVSLWYFVAAGLTAAVALPLATRFLHAYQWRRIEVFLDPDRDPLGAGYHITQAKIAFGAGGLQGQGFLNGSQNQLDFVPEKMTDFVFVAIAEEWGFAGAAVVLAAYGLAIGLLFIKAYCADNIFSRLVIASVALSLMIYVTINIGMVTGLVPVVGVPLPLISHGGTSMLTLLIGFGIAMSALAPRTTRP